MAITTNYVHCDDKDVFKVNGPTKANNGDDYFTLKLESTHSDICFILSEEQLQNLKSTISNFAENY